MPLRLSWTPIDHFGIRIIATNLDTKSSDSGRPDCVEGKHSGWCHFGGHRIDRLPPHRPAVAERAGLKRPRPARAARAVRNAVSTDGVPPVGAAEVDRATDRPARRHGLLVASKRLV